MSLPKDLLDQLLTGYLDDVLSVDERARVEQLLKSDPAIADELAQLRGLRQTLKAVAKADSAVKLDAGFADRVLAASVARARTEGLADDHPLIRLAEQPSVSPANKGTSSAPWRTASIMVGLAASIALAVIALRPQADDHQGIAAIDVDPGVASPEAPIVSPSEVVEPATPSPEMIAVAPDTTSIEIPVDSVEVPAVPTPPVPAIESVADASPSSPEVAPTPAAVPQGMIIALDVRRTGSGRESRAVEAAMLAESLEIGKKSLTKEIVGFVKENVNTDATPVDDVSVLYLNVSTKKFDRFHARLWNDREGIESVQMKLLLDAPLSKVVNEVRPDPTLVRHSDASYELFGADGLADRLDDIEFEAEPDRGSPRQLPLTLGPDVRSDVLILVR